MRDEWRVQLAAVGPDAALCPSCVHRRRRRPRQQGPIVPFLAAQRRALCQLSELGVDWAVAPSRPLRFTYRSKSAGDARGDRPPRAARSPSTSTRPTRPAASRSGPRSASTTARRSATSATNSATSCGALRRRRPGPARRVPRRCSATRRIDYAAPSTSTTPASTTAPGATDHASFYASAHPWEDFAESWAQVMHVHDVVSTGRPGASSPRPTSRRRRRRGCRRRSRRAGGQRAGPLDGHARPVPVRPVAGRPAKVEEAWRLTRSDRPA